MFENAVDIVVGSQMPDRYVMCTHEYMILLYHNVL